MSEEQNNPAVAMQTVFNGTIITLPIRIDSSKVHVIEYDIKPLDLSRLQEIHATNTSWQSGNHSRTDVDADANVRVTRGSNTSRKSAVGFETGEWSVIRETLFPNESSPNTSYVKIVNGNDEIDFAFGQVTGGNSGNITDDMTIGGRDSQPGRLFHGVIRNVKYYEAEADCGHYELKAHYPLDEVLSQPGDEVRDLLGGQPGVLTRVGELRQELREPALPELPGDGPEEPPIDPPPPEETLPQVVFAETFESVNAGSNYRNTGCKVRNDPTGAGKGKVMELAFAPGKLRPCSPSFGLRRGVTEATFEYEIYIDPKWADDWLKDSRINAKMGGPAGGTGGMTSCSKANTAMSCRLMLYAGRWTTYKYYKGKPDRCGNLDRTVDRIPGIKGWQKVKVYVKLNTPGKADGEYQLWLDDTTPGRKRGIPWRAAGQNFKMTHWRWEFFVNAGKKWEQAPRSANTFYITNFLATTPET